MKKTPFITSTLLIISVAMLSLASLHFGFAQSNDPSVQINSAGQVGIGTNPSGNYQLEVDGNLSATSFIGDGSQLTGITAEGSSPWQTSGSNIYYQNGNVGVGGSASNNVLNVNAVNKSAGIGGTLNSNQATGLQFKDNGTQHAGLRWGGGSNGANNNLYLEDASASQYPNSWYTNQSVNLVVRNGKVAASHICDENLSNCIDASSALKILNNITNSTFKIQTCTIDRQDSDGSGTTEATLGTWDFCYLSRVKTVGEDNGDDDSEDCNISESSNVWYLKAAIGTSNENEVKCQARCINFDGSTPSNYDTANVCS